MVAIHKFKSLISKSRVGTPDIRSPRAPRTPRTLEIPMNTYEASEAMRSEVNKPKEIGSEEIRPEEIRPEEIRPEEIRPEETRPEEIRPEETRLEEIRPEETKPSDEIMPTPTQDTTLSEARPRHKSIAEEAAELVEARKAYLASAEKKTQSTTSEGEKGHAHDPTDTETRFLGIGMGGRDDFASSGEPTHIVSDSPTGIDFDVYDRAFEAEVERIRSEKRGSRRMTYLTRLVNEKEKYLGDDCMVVEAGRSIPAIAASGMSKASSAAVRTLNHMGFSQKEGSDGGSDEGGRRELLREKIEAVMKSDGQDGGEPHGVVEKGLDKGHKFAELVMGTMQGVKAKAGVGESS
jgi:[calcium/calmodulin-dependent protein kinase] kinase